MRPFMLLRRRLDLPSPALTFDNTFGTGQLDAASTTNRIDAQGAVEMRVKQGGFTDFTFRGQMDQTGRRITGGLFGSGFTGQPFTIDKS